MARIKDTLAALIAYIFAQDQKANQLSKEEIQKIQKNIIMKSSKNKE